jgi:hypothetical protein
VCVGAVRVRTKHFCHASSSGSSEDSSSQANLPEKFERLRPRLREIAQQRFAGCGLRLEHAQARRLLGEEPCFLLERPREVDKFPTGPEPGDLRALLEALERI